MEGSRAVMDKITNVDLDNQKSVPNLEPTNKSNLDFLEKLRIEIIHHKDKRAEFVFRKLAFVVLLFGLGSINFDFIGKVYSILYLIPYIALVFDVYIFSEHYKVQRAGAYIRIYRYASNAERNWEKMVESHREPYAIWASSIVTILVFIASSLIILTVNPYFSTNQDFTEAWATARTAVRTDMRFALWFALWFTFFIVALIVVFLLNRKKIRNLPKSHLLDKHINELIASPGDHSEGRRNKLIIELVLNTGISLSELRRLKLDDIAITNPESDKKVEIVLKNSKLTLAKIKVQSSLGAFREKLRPKKYSKNAGLQNKKEARHIICRESEGFAEFVMKFCEELNAKPEWVTFNELDDGKYSKMSRKQLEDMLKKYTIIVDGAIHSVTFEELRRTYTRLMYRDGVCIRDIDKNLGGKGDVKKLIGFVGPLEQYQSQNENQPSIQ